MKRINIIAGIIIVIAFSIAAQTSFGQSSAGLRFSTDFDFYVHGDKFAAGSYSVEKLIRSADNHTVAIRSGDGRLSKIYMLVPPSSDQSTSTMPVVTFYRYGGEYFLSELRNPGRGFSARISGSKRKGLKALNRLQPEKIVVAARLDR